MGFGLVGGDATFWLSFSSPFDDPEMGGSGVFHLDAGFGAVCEGVATPRKALAFALFIGESTPASRYPA